MDGQPDRSRFLSSSAVMDTATPSPLFTDLARHTAGLVPSCTAADSSLHSRYIQASLPLGSASTCPFLGGMYAGSLPAPPSSPFRSPTGNIRQFWPPTPPPEGYSRYGVSPAIYPIFPSVASIAPSTENGTLLNPGLNSRLGTLPTHFPHLLDSYSDPTYYSSGYGLSSSLPPTSHITSSLPLSNLTPTLDRHPSYIPLVGRVKGLNITRQATDDDDLHRVKSSTNNFMTWDTPYTSESTKLTIGKTESQPKSKDFSSNKDETRSASCKGKGESRVSNRKNEVKHQLKQAVSSGGDSNKSTSVITPSLSSVLSDSYDLKSPNSKNGLECPKCVVNPSSVVRNANSVDLASSGDSAVICLGHTPAVATVTRTVAPSLPNCTTANNHLNIENGNVKPHQTIAGSVTQPPTAITYVSRQLCYQSISESTVSKSVTGTSSCLSVKISGHVTSVSSSQVVLDERNENKSSSEDAKVNIETPIWTEQKAGESDNLKDFQNTEEYQSEKSDKTPVLCTTSSNVLSSYTENTPSLQNVSLTKDHSQHTVKVPSNVSTIVHAHTSSNKLSNVCYKNLKNTKLNEARKNIKEINYLPIAIQPKKEQSSACKIEQVKPSLPNNWNEPRSLQITCDADIEPQAINLSLPQKLPKSEPNELPNCKNSNVMKLPVTEKSYLPIKSLSYNELSSNSHAKTNQLDSCIKPKKLINSHWPQTQNLVTHFESSSSCQSQVTAARSLSSVSVRTVKSCLSKQSVVPSSTPLTNVSSLVKPTLSSTTKSSLKSATAIKISGRGVADSNCHRNSVSITPTLSASIDNTRKTTTEEGANSTNSLTTTLSIPFSGTVNSSIPIGIAIAQQRQETTLSPKPDEKRDISEQNNHLTSVPVSSTANLLEIVRDHKTTDRIPRHSAPADAGGVLVTLGPTINSNQWDSDNNSRTSISQPWVTHTPVVTPTVWVGQSVPTTPNASTLPVMPVSTLDTTQLPVSTGGFQLARDPLTGHLYLIPATSIELTDHSGMWPIFLPSTGSVSLQQVIPHSQTNQVVENDQVADSTVTLQQSQTQIQSIRLHSTAPSDKAFCDINTTASQENHDTSQFLYHSVKQENKDEKSSDIPLLNGLPVATGQPFAYAAFSLHGGTISYYFEPSSVVHLAQTQVTASIQTESGKRSQGTSPLHSVTPSPPPINPSEQGTQASGTDDPLEEEEESDDSSSSNQICTQTKLSNHALAVATATQVDMNSDDDYEERNVETSDSACQTEAIVGNVREDGTEDDISLQSQLDAEHTAEIENSNTSAPPDLNSLDKPPKLSIAIENNTMHTETNKLTSEICQSDVEISLDSTPVLTAESKPVMDFIDHHGLDLLVDSIEEFACREQEMKQENKEALQINISNNKNETKTEKKEQKVSSENNTSSVADNKTTYPSLDPLCVDGLGLLCALAEQRFLEETMNSHEGKDKKKLNHLNSCKSSITFKSAKKLDINSNAIEERKSVLEPVSVSSVQRKLSSDQKFNKSLNLNTGDTMDATELEMRIRMAELQHKYKQKQQELSRLRPKKQKEVDACVKKSVGKVKGQQIFTYCKDRIPKKSNIVAINTSEVNHQNFVQEKPKYELDMNEKQNSIEKSQKVEDTSSIVDSNLKQAIAPCTKEKNKIILPKICTEVKTTTNYHSDVPATTTMKAISKPETISKSAENIKQPSTVSVPLSPEKIKANNNCASPVKSNMDKTTVQQITVQTTKNKSDKNNDDVEAPKLLKADNSTETTIESISSEKINEESTYKTKNTEVLTINKEKQNITKDEPEKKVPFFDEAVWSIRRSERIFLHEAGVVKSTYENSSSGSNKNKRTISTLATKIAEKSSLSSSLSLSTLSKSENIVKAKLNHKPSDSVLKTKRKIPIKKSNELSIKKTPKIQNKQNQVELLSVVKKNNTDSSSTSDSDSSDDSDSSSSTSSDDSDDTPLSALIKRPLPTPSDAIAKAKSCVMTTEKLQDKQRVLMMEDGLFYAGNVIAIHAPDVYGIHLDGDRGSRLRIYSMEEMLKETVLEVKPTSNHHLIEGSRVCAFWSQQYRCLYPGTVTKSNSLPSDDLIYVEFDDGDSGRIPLEDIRLLPPNYPIVTVKPTPLLALKRRHCAASNKQNIDDRKLTESLKDSCQINKKTKILQNSNKKSKTNQTEKSSHSFHLAKNSASTVTLPNNNENILSETQSSVGLSLMTSKKVIKTNSKITCAKETGEKSDKEKLNSSNKLSSIATNKPKKHKKHRDESKHHHHRHHHHHHHHKKHKINKQKGSSSSEQAGVSPVYTSSLESPFNGSNYAFSSDLSPASVSSLNANSSLSVQSNSPNDRKKSELTVKIKTNNTESLPHHHDELDNSSKNSSDCSDSSDSSDDESISNIPQEKKAKIISNHSENGEKKRRDRRPSVEKSKIAAFLPARQLWRWSGNCFRRRGTKGRAKKDYYRAVTRGKETIKVGDCAVFLSTGRPHLPYIGRIETMWQSWGGNMVVKVKWFYHPEETRGGKRLAGLKGALFQSSHLDENDVQTISHKCEVLSWEEYKKRRDQEVCQNPTFGSIFDNNDIYYLAGTYEPTTGIITMEPGIT